MKRILLISVRVLLLVAIVVGYGFTRFQEKKVLVQSVNIDLNMDQGLALTNLKEIEKRIRRAGYTLLEGMPLKEVDLNKLEKSIEQDPFVANAEVFSQPNGIIHIEVEQRKPVMRVQNDQEQSFLVDDSGRKMPVSTLGTLRVPVVSGAIRELGTKGDTLHHPMMKQLFYIAQRMEKDDFLQALVTQLYLNEEGKIEMIPLVGNQTILLGDTSRMDEKIHALEMLYRKGFKGDDWTQFKTINLMFKDQIVCTK